METLTIRELINAVKNCGIEKEDGDWFGGIDSKDFDDTADRLVKLFNIPNVSNRRELLLAFAEYWNGCKNSLIEESNIDNFLKGK